MAVFDEMSMCRDSVGVLFRADVGMGMCRRPPLLHARRAAAARSMLLPRAVSRMSAKSVIRLGWVNAHRPVSRSPLQNC
jgi:hypothetical protein